MSLAARLSIRGKLLLLVAPPILGYAFFNLHYAWTGYQELGAKGLLQQGVDLGQQIGRAHV